MQLQNAKNFIENPKNELKKLVEDIDKIYLRIGKNLTCLYITI